MLEKILCPFCVDFTEEDMDNLPDLSISPTPEMNKITINTEGAQNLLQHLLIFLLILNRKFNCLKHLLYLTIFFNTLGRFDEVEDFFVVWSSFIFTEHGVNVVVICLSAFALDNLF
jgi:hypothetical protein